MSTQTNGFQGTAIANEDSDERRNQDSDERRNLACHSYFINLLPQLETYTKDNTGIVSSGDLPNITSPPLASLSTTETKAVDHTKAKKAAVVHLLSIKVTEPNNAKYLLQELSRFLIIPEEDIDNPEAPYGDLYTKFIEALDTICDSDSDSDSDKESFMNLVEVAFLNKNIALEMATDPQTNCNAVDPTSMTIQLAPRRKLSINNTNPTKQGNNKSRFCSVFWPRFFPLKYTSMPVIIKYPYMEDEPPSQLRIGTQAKRSCNHLLKAIPYFTLSLLKILFLPLYILPGIGRCINLAIGYFISKCVTVEVNSIFKCFLKAKKIKRKGNTTPGAKIDHVYFNCLSFNNDNETGWWKRFIELPVERAFTYVLHKLEIECDNVAVITLPSDNGWLSHKYATESKERKNNT